VFLAQAFPEQDYGQQGGKQDHPHIVEGKGCGAVEPIPAQGPDQKENRKKVGDPQDDSPKNIPGGEFHWFFQGSDPDKDQPAQGGTTKYHGGEQGDLRLTQMSVLKILDTGIDDARTQKDQKGKQQLFEPDLDSTFLEGGQVNGGQGQKDPDALQKGQPVPIEEDPQQYGNGKGHLCGHGGHGNPCLLGGDGH